MMESINVLKVTVTGILATMTALWGWFGWLVLLWVGLMILDYATGSAAACRKGEWASKTAREGFWSKIGCVVAVMVAGLADLLIGLIISNIPAITLPFDYGVLLAPLVLVWYSITELGSIAENAVAMGAPVPKFLLRALEVVKDVVDKDEGVRG